MASLCLVDDYCNENMTIEIIVIIIICISASGNIN
jgi:hypothetical protein